MALEKMTELNASLPVSRDLTNAEETMKVLSIANDIIAAGQDLEEIKKQTYGSEATKPAAPVLLSAIGAAESKMLLQKCPAHHLVCVFAMYGEKKPHSNKSRA